MTWIVAILLALAGFAAIALPFRQPRASWAVLAAALAFGLAGYAMQASPGIASAPAEAASEQSEEGRLFVGLRVDLVGEERRSRSPFILMADEWVRRGRYEGATTLLRGAVSANPRDGDAWLALGNTLFLHADGQLTPASLLAYRHAEQELGGAAPAFFLGVAQIRQGEMIEAHRLWSERLAQLPGDAPGRDILAGRLAALEDLLRQVVANAGESGN